MEEILLYFSLKYNGDFEAIYRALESKEQVNESLKEKLLKDLHCKYTTMVSNDYPESLKYINYPPFVLYYYGNLECLNEKCIGVIGMRVPSSYGTSVTDRMVSDLVKEKYAIVSGMALGIDAMAHRAAMKNNGKTIAILGSGIDYCFPKSNRLIYQEMKEKHLIISEYPGNMVPQKYHFPRRNRIIAGLSSCLLVTEAKIKSGTMITVGHALEQGKDIYCIPSRIDENIGCNILIQQGAKLVNTVKDIIDDTYF